MTILDCCRLANVNPAQYLAHVLPRLARGPITAAKAADLLPAARRARNQH